MGSRRRNIIVPDDLWAAAILAAARQTLESGQQVSVSDIIRDALADKLAEHYDSGDSR